MAKKQLRITVPKWVAELKGWKESSNLQIIPIIKDEKEGITKDTIFVIKEIKKR
jgi:hypothetical protein